MATTKTPEQKIEEQFAELYARSPAYRAACNELAEREVQAACAHGRDGCEECGTATQGAA